MLDAFYFSTDAAAYEMYKNKLHANYGAEVN